MHHRFSEPRRQPPGDAAADGESARVRALEAERDALAARVRSLEAERDAAVLHRERLRESETQYRTLFQSIDQGFCTLEVLFDDAGTAVDYRFLEVNPAFEAHTGLADAAGRTMCELRPDHEEHWYRIYGDVARTGTAVRFEHRAAALDRWYDVFAFRVGAPEQHRVGVLFRDITEQRRSESSLREAMAAAESASRLKSHFMAVISHELRTPLTGIIGYTDLLETDVLGPSTQRQKDALGRIRSSSWHLVRIIDGILDHSRLEAGREQVHRELTDLAQLAAEVVRLVEPQARARGLRLVLETPDEPVITSTDAGKVRQILLNLVGNGAKYADPGELKVRLDAADADVLRVHVQDEGPGVAADDQDRIFEPFTQGSSPHGRDGTGLGLAISRQLARLLGGDIRLGSKPGQGSTFTLDLPRAEA